VARVVIVPGLAVRTYALPAVAALRGAGHDVELLPAPGWRGVPDRVQDYGRWLADRLNGEQSDVDVLVGLSVGTQAAAVAAAAGRVEQLLLVSPTVDPVRRTRRKLVATWLRDDHHPDSPSLALQLPDWSRAGLRRLYRCLVSAVEVRLEDELDRVTAPITIIHAGWDNMTGYDFAAALASRHGAALLELPAAPHSWPIGDEARFVDVINELTSGDRRPVRAR
jgi:hypothetical protein